MKLTHIYTNWRRLCSVGLLGMTMLVTAACGTAAGSSADQNAAQNNSQTGTLQAPTLDNTPVKDHYAVFNTTEGTFKVRLYGTKTPITVKNFDYLVKQGYYNDLTFHRVIDGFMIQSGDDGKGGPGYKLSLIHI